MDGIDIFEWFHAEQLLDDPPAAVTGVKEVAAFTEYPNGNTQRYDAPEYRPARLQDGGKHLKALGCLVPL